MSARRNTTLGNTASGASRRLPALLDLETRAAAVSGSGRFGWLDGDNLQEIARHFTFKEVTERITVDKRTLDAFNEYYRTFFNFAKTYKLPFSKNHWLGLILDLTRADLYGEGEGEGDGYKMLLNDLRDSGTEYLRVEVKPVSKLEFRETQPRQIQFWENAGQTEANTVVEHLHVSSRMFRNFPIDNLFKGVRVFTSLKILYIFCDEGWRTMPKKPTITLTEEFATTIQRLGKLTSVSLGGILLNGPPEGTSSIDHLCSGLKALQHLKILRLDSTYMQGRDWRRLAETLSSTSKLTELKITSDYEVGTRRFDTEDPAVELLSRMFQHQSNMTTFNTSRSGYGHKCIAALSRLASTSLTHLDVTANALKQDTHPLGKLDEIMPNFSFLSNVENLRMRSTRLSHTEIPTLIRAIYHMERLKAVDFSENVTLFVQYNLQSAKLLFNALSTRKHLKEIDFLGTEFQGEHVAQLMLIVRIDIGKEEKTVFASLEELRVPLTNGVTEYLRWMSQDMRDRLHFTGHAGPVAFCGSS